jgi:hypothetical protein
MKQTSSNSTKPGAGQTVAVKSEAGQADEQGWLSRWSRQKLAMRDVANSLDQQVDTSVSEVEQLDSQDLDALPTDADMPPIESLTESSDYSGFMSPKVSEHLRRQALRKLFSSSSFNVCDGLDDYDEDFTQFTKLGDIVTADMKHQLETMLRKELEQGRSSQSDAATAEKSAAQTDELESTVAITEQPDQNETSPHES